MSLLPGHYNFTIWRTATFRKSITVYQGGNPASGTRDLSGYSAQLVIKDEPGGTPLLTLDTGSNGGITLEGSAGTIDLFISASDTAALPWKSAVYDLEITAPAGDTDAILYGHFRVRGI